MQRPETLSVKCVTHSEQLTTPRRSACAGSRLRTHQDHPRLVVRRRLIGAHDLPAFRAALVQQCGEHLVFCLVFPTVLVDPTTRSMGENLILLLLCGHAAAPFMGKLAARSAISFSRSSFFLQAG